jgi:hypothetical protein
MMGGESMARATARSEEIEGGARITLTPSDPADLEALREHVRHMAAQMVPGQCPMMEHGQAGIALAALAALAGKRLTVTVPDGIPEEKKTLLRMLGAEVWTTPDDLCPVDHPKDGAIALAHSFLTSEPNRFLMLNQYDNSDNVRAHYETTGPEIWRQTDGKVLYFFASRPDAHRHVVRGPRAELQRGGLRDRSPHRHRTLAPVAWSKAAG